MFCWHITPLNTIWVPFGHHGILSNCYWPGASIHHRRLHFFETGISRRIPSLVTKRASSENGSRNMTVILIYFTTLHFLLVPAQYSAVECWQWIFLLCECTGKYLQELCIVNQNKPSIGDNHLTESIPERIHAVLKKVSHLTQASYHIKLILKW